MKKLFCLILAFVLTLSLIACGSSETPADTTTPPEAEALVLEAGFARENCNPSAYPVHIAGGDVYANVCHDGCMDPLTTTCIALRQGEETYLIFTCDTVDIDGYFCHTTDQTISDATGIPREQIILNATHTHSAPTLKHNLTNAAAYTSLFNQACVNAARRAIKDLSPVSEVSSGSIQTENMTRVRHYLMNDGTTYGMGHGTTASGYKAHHYEADEELQVIRIARTEESKKDIVLMSMPTHATIVSSGPKMLSADFPGIARAEVEKAANVHCAYFIGAAGDQVPNSSIGEVPLAKDYVAYGKKLATYVTTCLENNMNPTAGNTLKLYTENYVAKRMKEGVDDPVRLAHAMEISALAKQYGTYSSGPVAEKVKEYGFSIYYEATGLVTRSQAPETGDFDINAITIGNVGLVFAPYEMFSSHGKQIKDNTTMDMAFIITNSEDDQGYIPDENACEHSYYEYDIAKYARETGTELADRYLEILTALQNGTEVAPRQ